MYFSSISYLRVWQLLLKLNLLPWVVVVFSSKASKSRALPFDLSGSHPVSRPAEAVVCAAASWSKTLVLPTVFCGWWMESKKGMTWHLKQVSTTFKFSYQITNARKIFLIMNNSNDTVFTLHISSWLHSFFLSGSRTLCCLFRSHSFSMGQKANTVVS